MNSFFFRMRASTRRRFITFGAIQQPSTADRGGKTAAAHWLLPSKTARRCACPPPLPSQGGDTPLLGRPYLATAQRCAPAIAYLAPLRPAGAGAGAAPRGPPRGPPRPSPRRRRRAPRGGPHFLPRRVRDAHLQRHPIQSLGWPPPRPPCDLGTAAGGQARPPPHPTTAPAPGTGSAGWRLITPTPALVRTPVLAVAVATAAVVPAPGGGLALLQQRLGDDVHHPRLLLLLLNHHPQEAWLAWLLRASRCNSRPRPRRLRGRGGGGCSSRPGGLGRSGRDAPPTRLAGGRLEEEALGRRGGVGGRRLRPP